MAGILSPMSYLSIDLEGVITNWETATIERCNMEIVKIWLLEETGHATHIGATITINDKQFQLVQHLNGYAILEPTK